MLFSQLHLDWNIVNILFSNVVDVIIVAFVIDTIIQSC